MRSALAAALWLALATPAAWLAFSPANPARAQEVRLWQLRPGGVDSGVLAGEPMPGGWNSRLLAWSPAAQAYMPGDVHFGLDAFTSTRNGQISYGLGDLFFLGGIAFQQDTGVDGRAAAASDVSLGFGLHLPLPFDPVLSARASRMVQERPALGAAPLIRNELSIDFILDLLGNNLRVGYFDATAGAGQDGCRTGPAACRERGVSASIRRRF